MNRSPLTGAAKSEDNVCLPLMDRSYYLDLARTGLRMPIGADLVLHEHADPEAIAAADQRRTIGTYTNSIQTLDSTPRTGP